MVSAPRGRRHGLDADLQKAAELFAILGNEHRLRMLCALRSGELSVGRLAEAIALSQSALSQHLARLRADGAVATRREGQTIHYRIADPDVLTLLSVAAKLVERRRSAAACGKRRS